MMCIIAKQMNGLASGENKDRHNNLIKFEDINQPHHQNIQSWEIIVDLSNSNSYQQHGRNLIQMQRTRK